MIEHLSPRLSPKRAKYKTNNHKKNNSLQQKPPLITDRQTISDYRGLRIDSQTLKASFSKFIYQ